VARSTKRDLRYRELLRRHFLPEEARELSKFRSLRYAEVRRMTGSRQLFYNRFRRHYPELEAGTRKFQETFKRAVYDWYRHKDLTTFNHKMRRVLSPWDWVDRVSYALPEELRYTKGGRRKNSGRGGVVESPAQRAKRIQWIHELKDTLKREPRRAPQLVQQILRLGGRVPEIAMRKARL